MSTTIKDVAKDTGLSLATISKYLNNKKISEENRILIEKSIKKLNYIPNRTTQTLRSKTSHCICIFMPDISDYHFGYECNYIVKYMKSKGYSTMVRSYSSDNSMNDILFLKKRQIDGVILFTDTVYPSSFIFSLSTNKIPYVCMHQRADIPSDFVGCDDKKSGELAASYLYKHGHTQVALLGLASYSSSQKVHGFLEKFISYGCAESRQSVLLHSSHEEILQNYRNYFSSVTFPPTAILFLDHNTTLTALGEFMKPVFSENHLSLLAFEDDDIFSAISPALTVFSQNNKELGRTAANLLLKRISGNFDDFPSANLIPSIFIERESVKNIHK